jgi:hypothetical protein
VADRGVIPPRLFVDIPAQVTQEHTSSSTQIMRSSGRDERQKSPIRYSGTASLSHHTAFSHDHNTKNCDDATYDSCQSHLGDPCSWFVRFQPQSDVQPRVYVRYNTSPT